MFCPNAPHPFPASRRAGKDRALPGIDLLQEGKGQTVSTYNSATNTKHHCPGVTSPEGSTGTSACPLHKARLSTGAPYPPSYWEVGGGALPWIDPKPRGLSISRSSEHIMRSAVEHIQVQISDCKFYWIKALNHIRGNKYNRVALEWKCIYIKYRSQSALIL